MALVLMNLDNISYREDRKTLGVFLLLVICLFLVLFDVLVFRPRENVTRFDRAALLQELQQLVGVTSAYGSWQNEFVLLKPPTGLVVSKDFIHQEGKEKALLLLSESLQNTGWKPYYPSYKSALITLCKGKYRVSLEWIDATCSMGTSFTVKEFKKEMDCS